MGTGAFLRSEYLYGPSALHVCTMGRYNSIPWEAASLGTGATSSVAWPTNNLAVYVPISIPAPFTVARFMIANASNLTGTVDIGIYNAAGVLLLSTGNSARASASAVQYLDVTNTVFQPGHYYLGLVASSTTGTYLGATFSSSTRAALSGPLQEALGSATLVNPMTPTAYAQTSIFQYGFTQSDTV